MHIHTIYEPGPDQADNQAIHKASIGISAGLEGLDIDVAFNILMSSILNTTLQNDYPGVRKNVIKNLRALADVIESDQLNAHFLATQTH